METVIDGYYQDHPVTIERELPDGHYKNITWLKVRAIDGTRPFNLFGEYEQSAWIRSDLIRKENNG